MLFARTVRPWANKRAKLPRPEIRFDRPSVAGSVRLRRWVECWDKREALESVLGI